ncbi:alpha/beta fold hydrolase [Methylobacterium organophilum]|uniref:FMN reductase (NADH) RutF n=1 Tax=Methylobacterium organophilum TaxID=410 RepID=A0ABQ4TC12_METOR|nr:alpha/beta fold hydrolase [Methylobacterium organophilum]GJE27670.1 FMN reductase (NADH) RutF [Methylobacterium organophilum]
MPEVASRSVPTGGTGRRTLIVSAGAETGATPILFIHGVGLDHTVWRPQMAAFAGQRPVHAYDMMGHGGSDGPAGKPELADYAAQLVGVLDALKIGRAHLVGHSMGAMVALEAALSHPERVGSVTALNAVYRRSAEQSRAVLRRVEALEAGEAGPGVETTLARWFGSPVPPSLAEEAERMRALLERADGRGYALAYRVFATADAAYAERLPGLSVPALFMTGQHDPNSTPDMTRAMAAAVPGARGLVLSGERHMMPLVGAARVNAEIARFLAGLETQEPAAAPKRFRNALGAFATGVTVVTTLQEDGEPRGFTANSFSSVSLDPPLVSICIARTASSHPVFKAAPRFAVNILAQDQRDVSGVFASKRPDKFEQVAWASGATGSPVLEGCAAWFDCRLHQVVAAGDHDILIGEVVDFDGSGRMPLGYCRGAYVEFGLAQEAVAAAARSIEVKAILEAEGEILLVEAADGTLSLPAAHHLEPLSDPTSLHGKLAELGVAAELGFLFAVYEDPGAPGAPTSIVYRGAFSGTPGRGTRLWPVTELADCPVRDPASRTMLERYARESRENAFGVYSGNASEGRVYALRHDSAA